MVSFRRADQQPAEYAVEIYSSVAKSTIFKSKILNKEIFWDVIILTFVFKDCAISNQVPLLD